MNSTASLHFQGTQATKRLLGDKPIGGFVAGTLVHTSKGLVPIQAIKLGDLVLSRPENGGETAFKRVIRTFSTADQSVLQLNIYKLPVEIPSTYDADSYEIDFLGDWLPSEAEIEPVFCTANHPFWVENRGWTPVDEVGFLSVLHLIDGRTLSMVRATSHVYKTIDPNIVWITEDFDGFGPMFD